MAGEHSRSLGERADRGGRNLGDRPGGGEKRPPRPVNAGVA
ncbi:hypothetical protein LC55x_4304 [Lysobacter capsici]|nr:hypothetical protein LC55x_4304 [Lysobacter capsici]